MKLTAKQSELINKCNDPDYPVVPRDNSYRNQVERFNKRAYPLTDKDIYIRRGNYFPSTYPPTYFGDRLMFTDVHGSGEHRTARSLEKMGLGRVFYIRPLEPAFFKLVGSKGEALAGLIGSDGNIV